MENGREVPDTKVIPTTSASGASSTWAGGGLNTRHFLRVFKFTTLIFLVIFQLLRLLLFYFSIAHIHLLGLAGGFLSLKN